MNVSEEVAAIFLEDFFKLEFVEDSKTENEQNEWE